MTCPRCARDLLALALDALARGDMINVAQPLREAITEWDDPGEARAMTGELARLEKLGQSPNIRYWLDTAARKVEGPPLPMKAALPNEHAYQPTPCGHCPGVSV